MASGSGWMRLLSQAAGYVLRAATGEQGSTKPARRDDKPTAPGDRARPRTPAPGGEYPGDYEGMPRVTYQPRDDDVADPGEVVWTWVPYEEDYAQGKDRPVLVIGWDDAWLLALPVTSKDHDRDAAQEAAAGRYWFDIGTGEWDRDRRPSEARVNRVVRVDPSQVRRTGGRLTKDRFEAVIAQMRKYL